MIGIYKITSPTQKIYIGQSVNIEKRRLQYQRLICKNQVKLFNSLKKYGWDAHLFEIVCECTIQDLNEKERYYQDLFNTMQKGLNCRLTTANDKSGIISQETKSKISLGNLGKKCSEETKMKMSISSKGKSKGPKSENHKNKLRNALLGKTLTEKHIANIKKSRKYGKDHPMYGKKRPELAERNKAQSSKPCVVDGVRFDSVVQAANILGISKYTLYDRIKNNTNKKCYYCCLSGNNCVT